MHVIVSKCESVCLLGFDAKFAGFDFVPYFFQLLNICETSLM